MHQLYITIAVVCVLHLQITQSDDAWEEDELISDVEESYTLEDCHNKPNNLQELLNTPGFCDTISMPVERSPAELLLMTLKYSIVNKLPLTSVANLLGLINSIFPTPVTPESRYMINKLCNPKDSAEFHATCPNCSTYVGKFETLDDTETCENCQTSIDTSNHSSGSYFAIVDPSEAIAEYLHSFEDHYYYVTRERQYEKGHIKDVYDGKCYREFVKNLPESEKYNYITAAFNTDGAPVFESSTYSIWPIYLMINEFPVEHRLKNMIVCGLWFGKNKPQMNIFLDTFVEKINYLSTVGIPCTIKAELLTVKLYALICCVDTIARAPMNGTMQFNAFFGCDWCLHPGEWINGSMRYPVLEGVCENRDMHNTIKLMKEAVKKGLAVFGVKNVSPLINLYFFDIIKGFIPDYLHCFLAGVVKQLTELIIQQISAEDFKRIELRIAKIKAPNQLGRLSRPLKERSKWKAREWENWLLYYSVPVLESIISTNMLQHWGLMVESLHILLKADISCTELEKADRMLHEFVFGVEQIYSKTAMTYNVHQLLHIARSVYDWGPLWAHSTFPFESGNHQLLTAIKCARGVNLQILRYINMQRSIDILEKHIYPLSSIRVEQYCSDLGNRKTKKCLQIAQITYFGSTTIINKQLRDMFKLSSNTRAFMRMVKSGCLYASCRKENARSCNSFAQLANKTYIRISQFVVDGDSDQHLAICHVIQTTSCDSAKSLKKICNIGNELIAVKTTEISKICVFLNVSDTRYICEVPNLYKY